MGDINKWCPMCGAAPGECCTVIGGDPNAGIALWHDDNARKPGLRPGDPRPVPHFYRHNDHPIPVAIKDEPAVLQMTDRPLTTGEGKTMTDTRTSSELDVLHRMVEAAEQHARHWEAECGRLREQLDAARREADSQMQSKLDAQVTLRAVTEALDLRFDELGDGWREAAPKILARIEMIVDEADRAFRERDALRGVSNAYGCFAGCTGALAGAPADGSGHTPACRAARAALGVVGGPQPDQGSAPTENVGRARDEEPS